MILIATLTIPYQGDPQRPAKPQVTLAWPGMATDHFTLHNHDWGNDLWDWRNGKLPESLTRDLWERFFAGDTVIDGIRLAYISPKDVGTGSNEQGRVMVYEIEYQNPAHPFEIGN